MFYFFTLLISSIVQNYINEFVRIFLSQFLQSFTYTVRIQIFFFSYFLCFQGNSIHKPKEIHPLSSIGRRHTHTFFAPGVSPGISINQVYPITEKYLNKSICCHIQQRKQNIVQKIQLCLQICFSRYAF